MTERYSGFDDLRRSEAETDFAVRLREGRSGVTILAPHGGRIEPGTSEIAEAVAGREHTFYAFEGLKPKGNWILHITSTKFDEPLGLAAARRAALVLTIHGCAETRALVYVGSRDSSVSERFRLRLVEGGFSVGVHPMSALRGCSPGNLCNKGTGGLGVQLEISRGLRESMFANLASGMDKSTTRVFDAFVTAVRRAIADLEPRV